MCSFQCYTSRKCTFITAEPFRVLITPYLVAFTEKKSASALALESLHHCPNTNTNNDSAARLVNLMPMPRLSCLIVFDRCGNSLFIKKKRTSAGEMHSWWFAGKLKSQIVA